MNATGRKTLASLVLIGLLGLAASPAAAKFPKIGKKGGGCTPFQKSDAWQAYLHDDKGQECVMPQPVENASDREWMFLRFTEYRGPKPRLAIMRADNQSGYQDIPIDGLEGLLGTIIFNTQRFVLVERQRLSNALDEQDFGVGGRISEPTAAAIGKVQGAEYLIFTEVVEWAPEKSKIGGRGGKSRSWYRKGGAIAGSVSKSKAEVAINFRVVDAVTSTVLTTFTTRAVSKSWGIGGGGGKGGGLFGGLGFSKNAPISYAVQAAMAKATYKIAYFLTERPWRGSVMDVIDNVVMINAGSDQGIERNMIMTVLHKGRELIDPETGQSRGSRVEVIGTARVTAVEPGFSEAAIVDGCDGVTRGDRVEILSEAAAGTARSARHQSPSPSPVSGDNPNSKPQAITATPQVELAEQDGGS